MTDETEIGIDAIYFVKALDRGLQILDHLRINDRGLSLEEMRSSTGIPKPTLIRLLATLESRRLVYKEDTTGSYTLGVGVIELSRAYLANLDLHYVARPIMFRLMTATSETAHLGVMDQMSVIYLDMVRPTEPVGTMIASPGLRLPGHCTAMGKAMLSCLEKDELVRLMAEHNLERRTLNTITSVDGLLADLQEARKRGYAVDHEELVIGIRAIAAPVFEYPRRLAGAISIGALVDRLSDDRIEREVAPLVCTAAMEISLRLGAHMDACERSE